MKPIYKPTGAAGEYGDLALNIYTGCNHRCYYCFAPNVLHKTREDFHTHVEPRKNIVEEVRRQIDRERITGQLIHLCFTCDPYPAPPVDTTSTREIIKAIKESGNHVQILTKGGKRALRDFDLLDGGDWFGVTVSSYYGADTEPLAADPPERTGTLLIAKTRGIRTWVSCEPVLHDTDIYHLIKIGNFIDRFKIGKLNYHPSDINWAEFGQRCEQLCIEYGRDYYIKDSLRKEMERCSK